MGWASGTSVFDTVVESTIAFIDPEHYTDAYQPIFEELRNGDWDTVDESAYFYRDWMLPILRAEGYFTEWFTEENWREYRDAGY